MELLAWACPRIRVYDSLSACSACSSSNPWNQDMYSDIAQRFDKATTRLDCCNWYLGASDDHVPSRRLLYEDASPGCNSCRQARISWDRFTFCGGVLESPWVEIWRLEATCYCGKVSIACNYPTNGIMHRAGVHKRMSHDYLAGRATKSLVSSERKTMIRCFCQLCIRVTHWLADHIPRQTSWSRYLEAESHQRRTDGSFFAKRPRSEFSHCIWLILWDKTSLSIVWSLVWIVMLSCLSKRWCLRLELKDSILV